MKDVGLKLKTRREELGYTLEEMSIKTKIQPHYLKALEEGDLDFFKDDFSYLRYFVRFYCQALQLDFEEIRDDFESQMDEFNETQSLKKRKDLEAKQKTINKRIQDSKGMLKPEKRKVDYSLISLILVVVFMIGAIVVFAVKLGPSLFTGNQPSPTPTIVAVLPSDNPLNTEDPAHTEAPKTPETRPLTVTTADGYNYEVRGWEVDDQVSIRIDFGRETWMRISYNGVVTDNPVSKTYMPEESMEILVKAAEDFDITVHFGAIKDNRIYINGEEYVLDDRVKELVRGQQLHFILKGE